jgi:hypothetical protein
VLAVQFQQNLIAGIADVVLAPTDSTWAWRIEESINGSPSRTIYATVPNVESIPYTDLVQIDPNTLMPTALPGAAWSAMLAETDTRLSAGTITPDPDDPGFFLIGA